VSDARDDYVEIDPPPALRAFVQRLWVHRLEGPPPPEGRRLLPDGKVHLVWMREKGVQVAGPQTRYGTPPDIAPLLVLGASFHPGAAPQLLRTPAWELVDGHVLLEDIDPGLARRLDDRIANAHDPRAAVRAFADELARSLRAAGDPDPAVGHAVRLLSRTTATVADAAARAFVSERELQRRFVEHVGYGPKTLQRVLRFQRFLNVVAAPGMDLAGAAALAGYADQSHLTRETRRLAGLTPSRLRTWTH
jgi:AraC-like DNA-binding protein